MPEKTPRAAGEQSPEGTRFVADVLAENIRSYRHLARLEQEDVAGRMWNLGHGTWRRVTVSEVERGLRNVTVPELISLVLVLGATVEQLLDPRGPGGKAGPGMRLKSGRQKQRWEVVDPRDVSGLVCGHEVDVEPEWTLFGIKSIKFTERRSAGKR